MSRSLPRRRAAVPAACHLPAQPRARRRTGIYFRTNHSRARSSSLRAYTERLLDPQISEQELPSGDDDLGALAQSLRRTVPRIRALLESLKLEGARREAILASMVEGVLAVDKDLRVTFCNNSFARTVGARIPVNPGMQLLGTGSRSRAD